MIIVAIFLLYVVSIFGCCMYHTANNTRTAVGAIDFLKLTFAPYVIYKKLRGEEL